MLAQRKAVLQLQNCDPAVFGDVIVSCQSLPMLSCNALPISTNIDTRFLMQAAPKHYKKKVKPKILVLPEIPVSPEVEKRRASALVDQLLVNIYNHSNLTTDYYSGTSAKSQRNFRIDSIAQDHLKIKDAEDLSDLVGILQDHVTRIGSILVRQLKRRDALRRHRQAICDVITVHLHERRPEHPDMRFSIEPLPGESGFSQWHSAMKMVVQLPEGIPPEFRCRLWLTLAEKHIASRGIDWAKVERNCFSEWSHPADAELGVQIVKDLHRTGCSLFCGEDGQENQGLLKKVLLAYARWNKNVGYCQGFNMLAALILQVTEKCETDALKLMIYLIEGVLPDSYFADSLRGLSVDMAVFRELLRTRLPRLSRHLDNLQKAAKDGSTSYEPPLTNVFTMQWFLTLFCNCLPQEVVLRVWDLILLEGNEILLRTALAIWQALQDRIMSVRSADEFYCIMGVLTREMLEFGFVDANSLIKAVVVIGPLKELNGLREHYLYNINPWSAGPSSSSNYEDNSKQVNLYPKDKLMLDIGVLKKQYSKLKQRQRQAHIIFSAAVSRQPPRTTPVAVNHLLLGRNALVPVKRLGPPKGAVPPPRKPVTIQWKDTERKSSSSSSSSDTELCDDPNNKSEDEVEPLEEDNSIAVDDNNKITTDNISSADTNTAEDLIEAKSNENSINESDDGFDFEKFLEERIRCLKQNSVCSEDSTDTSSDDKVSNARKNSERALEIIQENSLILHRILQCQSRYSPMQLSDEDRYTPSPINNEEVPSAIQDINIEEDYQDIVDNQNDEAQTPIQEDTIEPGTKYKDILEYSRNLNEKYKALILDDKSTSSKASECSYDRKSPNNVSPSSLRLFTDLPLKNSPEDVAPSRSPSQIYNPFPVRLSTRQNKEVAVKLGLYKK